MRSFATVGVLLLLLAACGGPDPNMTAQQIDEEITTCRDQVKKEWEEHWAAARIGKGTPGGYNKDVTEFAKAEFWKSEWPQISKAFEDARPELRKSMAQQGAAEPAARREMILAEAQKQFDKALAADNWASRPVAPPPAS